jgi:hypothetical protein
MGDIIILAGGINNQNQFATAPAAQHPKSSMILSDNSKLNTVGSTGSMGTSSGG